ncbi:MAG: hypothetical protein HOE55_07475 [Thiotrichales bacterium]|jgi:hypothetical protein|nr:hypothetical protein [Thiotrichales bacterium]MBT3613592.1 hypothetical protein [Thiotrichales bacterium]MBT3752310.1 hypothetical protein [Thiotrichales bacterium]MBT3837703.1 hypothetical protein [Thiotrichales bacterium]MBT4152876.1 hypothetical protein [Thiotrichales bacterium]
MNTFTETLQVRKNFLEKHLVKFMGQLAERCAQGWGEREKLDAVLMYALKNCDEIPSCRLLYIVDIDGVQISSNMFPDGSIDSSSVGQNLSERPYISKVVPSDGFFLSDVYISKKNKRSLLTAVQLVRGVDVNESPTGYVCADFELGMLPEMEEASEDRRIWLQVKGDPSIRHQVFTQSRAVSPMDDSVDDVVSIVDELIVERGIFHAKLHFSSSRATIWLYEDPYRYRVHVLDEILNPSVCLAYPRRKYPENALVPQESVRKILERFKWLREIDETIYLRAGSLNIINGIVALNFSCDGSHYLPYEEFLDKGDSFWFGS